MKFRNFKMVDYVIFGRGAFNQLGEIIAPHRKGNAPMIFFVDHHFEGNAAFAARFPLEGKDKIVYIDVTDEPKTKVVDALRDQLAAEFGTVSGIIGVGGGSVMDMAKAVSLMMNNPGSS
ncbi:MAG TPA: iron-containing alcohol dehydrogenase, partial [Chitinophaga sp.]